MLQILIGWLLLNVASFSTPCNRHASKGLLPLGDIGLAAIETPPGLPKLGDGPAQKVTSASTGMKFVLVPAGTFQMGSPETEAERDEDEGPQHAVRISKPFYLGIYEVTQEEYELIVGFNPSTYSVNGRESHKLRDPNTKRFPVENISWFDAVDFCNKLSAKDGLEPFYLIEDVQRGKKTISSATVSVAGGNGYRLPTEAEWEYACRATTKTAFHFGSVSDGRQSNINGTVPYGTSKQGVMAVRPTIVGSYRPNSFGLYDMHGNVYEWCDDVYEKDLYPFCADLTIDPRQVTGSPSRVMRGGSRFDPARTSRSANRHRYFPDGRTADGGFRVAKTA